MYTNKTNRVGRLDKSAKSCFRHYNIARSFFLLSYFNNYRLYKPRSCLDLIETLKMNILLRKQW